MRIVKYRHKADPGGEPRVGLLDGDSLVVPIGEPSLTLSELLHSTDPASEIERAKGRSSAGPIDLDGVELLAPIDRQEVWGAGVTYLRSKQAREEESELGASFYDLVYKADRPELFFKANPHRVAGPGRPIRVRRDTKWCVPEPELALVISPRMKIVGFTIGNDVSARDIEGTNPLYLPQAKTFDGCCGLGPSILVATDDRPMTDASIGLRIERGREVILEDSTSVARMARNFEELIGWLGRESSFPDGVILLTGTGIIPPDDFTLHAGDVVTISIDGIGSLSNPVDQRSPG